MNNLTSSSSSSSVNFRFTQDQKEVLQDFWSKGMNSCSKDNSSLTAECSRRANCSVEQVLHWINAEIKRQKITNRRSQTENTEPAPVISILKGRKRTAFQVFCHENSSSLTPGEGQSKMPVLGQMWSSLNKEEKEEWREKAKGFSWISTPKQKTKAIRELIASTKDNLKSLAALGVEGYGVLLNISNSDCNVLCGSETTQGFIDAEESSSHAVDNTFFKYMCAQSYMKKRKKTSTYDEMLGIVRSELKQKYRAVTGKGRIPYSCPSTLGCIVSGLPQGMEFKQPKEYSSSELRKLYDNIDRIKFASLNAVPDVGTEETVSEA